jgi:hypothetical protein
MEVSNTLAYCNTEAITAVKSLIVHVPRLALSYWAQRHSTQHNDNSHNDTQRKGLICDTEHK